MSVGDWGGADATTVDEVGPNVVFSYKFPSSGSMHKQNKLKAMFGYQHLLESFNSRNLSRLEQVGIVHLSRIQMSFNFVEHFVFHYLALDLTYFFFQIIHSCIFLNLRKNILQFTYTILKSFLIPHNSKF